MKFTHKGVGYYVDDIVHSNQGIDPELRTLDADFTCMGETIPAGFVWNGASTPNGASLRWIAPKFYRNLKASCLHDYLCGKATCKSDRLKADAKYFMMKKYVELDESWKCSVSWAGVRIGAFFGIGNSF